MKQILIVSATSQELAPFFQHFGVAFNPNQNFQSFKHHQNTISILITGVGMVNTAFELGKHWQSSFDSVLNVGIAGAFKRDISLGECVFVAQDVLAEMGAEDGDDFIFYKDLNLGGSNEYSAKYQQQFPVLNGLKKVKGITVNKVHGSETNIQKNIQLFNADVESMEGAAFYRAGLHMAPIVVQIRSISNRIEKRDKSKWQIPLAIQNLNQLLIQLIEQSA